MKMSIVTITYNRGNMIGETIQSVVNQTYTDFEYIIIDDGSDDDTEAVVKSFDDMRIQYYKYEKNVHQSFLRNEGFRKATGKYVSMLDSDDLWMPDKLEKIVNAIRKDPAIDFITHDVGFISLDAQEIAEYGINFSGNLLKDLLESRVLPFQVFTIRKESLVLLGYLDESLTDGQNDLFLQAAAKFTTHYIEEKLTVMKKHTGNISNKVDMLHFSDYLKSLQKLASENKLTKKEHRLYVSRIQYKMGYIYNREGNFSMAKKHFLSTFKLVPTSIIGLKSLIYLSVITLKVEK